MNDFVKLTARPDTSPFMRSPLPFVLASFVLCASGCFLAPSEQVVGSFDSGVDGGAPDAGSPGADAGPDGDATCDQSPCLPPTYVLSRTGVSQLALDGDAVIALGSMYGSGLARLELSTGATTVLQYDQSNPLDASGSLRVSGGWAGDIAMGATADQALAQVRLVMLMNDISMRRFTRKELQIGFGLIRAKGVLRDLAGALKLLKLVGTRCEVTDAPENIRDPRGCVCIGLKGRLGRAALDSLFERMGEE